MKSNVAHKAEHQRPRIVTVTRKTLYEGLLELQGTDGQADFFLKARGQKLEPLKKQDAVFKDNLQKARQEVPADVRRVSVDRDQLDRFLFAPDDIVVAVGQDGLIPNVAKYLNGQLVVGVNPDPANYDGVLCRHRPDTLHKVLEWAEAFMNQSAKLDPSFRIERRAMAVAERDDGLKLLALNEVFIGHKTHQSARYRLHAGHATERHSSSGVICSTGTGCTGWARSIAQQRGINQPLPAPGDESLAWFVREPFPSVVTGTSLNFGLVHRNEQLTLYSEMPEGGVVFCDGIEQDRLDFLNGQIMRIGVADRMLNLVIPTLDPAADQPAQQSRARQPQRQAAQTHDRDEPHLR